jgi:hypothetical protein
MIQQVSGRNLSTCDIITVSSGGEKERLAHLDTSVSEMRELGSVLFDVEDIGVDICRSHP